MKKEELVFEIVAKATGLAVVDVNKDCSSANTSDWDSLAQLSIMIALAAQFPEIADSPDLPKANSVSAIFALLDLRI